MKISRSLVAAALSGALVLGGTTAAIAQIPDAADSINIALPATIEVDGVVYFKKTKTGEDGEEVERYESAGGKEISVLQVKAIVDRQNASKEEEQESESSTAASESEKTSTAASESEKTTEPKATTSEKTTEPKASESASATKSSEASESTSATKSSEASESTSASKTSEASESTSASKTSEPSESKSAEPTPTDEPGDKKSSARDALSSKDGKPTPLAIFGIVAGVLAAVAAAFPVIAKTLNLNIKLPF